MRLVQISRCKLCSLLMKMHSLRSSLEVRTSYQDFLTKQLLAIELGQQWELLREFAIWLDASFLLSWSSWCEFLTPWNGLPLRNLSNHFHPFDFFLHRTKNKRQKWMQLNEFRRGNGQNGRFQEWYSSKWLRWSPGCFSGWCFTDDLLVIPRIPRMLSKVMPWKWFTASHHFSNDLLASNSHLRFALETFGLKAPR